MCSSCELAKMKMRYEILMQVSKDFIEKASDAAREAAILKARIVAEESSRRLRLVK